MMRWSEVDREGTGREALVLYGDANKSTWSRTTKSTRPQGQWSWQSGRL